MNDRMARWGAPAALALFVVIGAASSSRGATVVVTTATVAVIVGLAPASTSWRLLVVVSVVTAAVAVMCSGSPSNVGWFALCVLVAWSVIRGGPVLGIAYSALVVVLLIVEWTVLSPDPGWAAWIAGTAFTTVACLLVRRQRDLIDQLHIAQAGLADRARIDERSRIARELHDVIGHSLVVSLLHVTTARLAVEEDPGEAIEALNEAERLGRQSLAEVRQAVGLLREPGTSMDAPMPGADQMPALVGGFRRAGADLRYQVLGDPAALTATAGLTSYRILQEALTNAVRHAPGAKIAVVLDVSTDQVRLTIDSDGAPVVASGDGVGLHSMRERAEALGGQCWAGPSATGWCVRAVLPREPARAAAELG